MPHFCDVSVFLSHLYGINTLHFLTCLYCINALHCQTITATITVLFSFFIVSRTDSYSSRCSRQQGGGIQKCLPEKRHLQTNDFLALQLHRFFVVQVQIYILYFLLLVTVVQLQPMLGHQLDRFSQRNQPNIWFSSLVLISSVPLYYKTSKLEGYKQNNTGCQVTVKDQQTKRSHAHTRRTVG